MKWFSNSHVPSLLEYQINPQVYYLRFVRRDATLGKQAVTMPINEWLLEFSTIVFLSLDTIFEFFVDSNSFNFI